MNAYTVLLFPALVLFAVFMSLNYWHFRRSRDADRSRPIYSPHTFASRVRRDFEKFMIGFSVLGLGVGLLDLGWLLRAVGIYLCIIGYQIVLWAVGIESEWLGNIPKYYPKNPNDSEEG